MECFHISFSVFLHQNPRVLACLATRHYRRDDRCAHHAFPYVISLSQLQLCSPKKHGENLQKHKGEGWIHALCSEKRLASLFVGCHRESFMRKVLKSQQELIKLTQFCKNRKTSRSLIHYIQISTRVTALQGCQIWSAVFMIKSGVYYCSAWWSIKHLQAYWFIMCGMFFFIALLCRWAMNYCTALTVSFCSQENL